MVIWHIRDAAGVPYDQGDLCFAWAIHRFLLYLQLNVFRCVVSVHSLVQTEMATKRTGEGESSTVATKRARVGGERVEKKKGKRPSAHPAMGGEPKAGEPPICQLVILPFCHTWFFYASNGMNPELHNEVMEEVVAHLGEFVKERKIFHTQPSRTKLYFSEWPYTYSGKVNPARAPPPATSKVSC